MKMKNLFMLSALCLSMNSFAEVDNHDIELDPFAADIESRLLDIEGEVEELDEPFMLKNSGCIESQCAVYVEIDKATQTASVYENGSLLTEFLVSTGKPGHETPRFNKRFESDARVYTRYMSSKYPSKSGWIDPITKKDLGNMPYAVFIKGGFAIHGTVLSAYKKLGKKDSHGCIRSRTENGKIVNGLVRKYKVANSWIKVKN